LLETFVGRSALFSDQSGSSGKGADWFQLGDIAGSFYAQHGTADYVLIKDFSSDDHLLLHGAS